MGKPKGLELLRLYGTLPPRQWTAAKLRRNLLARIRRAVRSGNLLVVATNEEVAAADGPAVTAEALAVIVLGLLPDPARPLPRPGDPDGGDCLTPDWREKMPALFEEMFRPRRSSRAEDDDAEGETC